VTIPELKKDLESTVTFVGRTIDPLSRTFTIEIDLPSEKDLRPNMTGIVKVIHHTADSALVVPINAVQDVNGEKIVFVAETNGKNTVARKKVVQVEGVYNGQAQITGLNAGDQGLNDGEFLKI
jgi:hypothetical protein